MRFQPSAVRQLRCAFALVVASAFTFAHATPPSVTTIATGLGGPIGLTFDNAGDLIVADLQLGALVKISRSGQASAIAIVTGAYMPRYDASGNLYVSSFTTGELVRFAPNGAASLVASGLQNPAGMWIEATGTILLAQAGGTSGVVRLEPATGVTTPLNVGVGYEVAVDDTGRFLVSRFGSGTVTRFALPSTVGSTVVSGLSGVGGLAFDIAGGLYVAAQGAQKIVHVSAGGVVSDFVTGLHSPRGLAFDAAGGLYVSNRNDGTIQRIGSDTTAPIVTVPATMVVEALGASGAAATFGASALDDVPGVFDVLLSHASGATFPLGATTVTATATDPAGNTGTAAFQIVVQDTMAPAMAAPANKTVEAVGVLTPVSLGAATATDLVGVAAIGNNAPPEFPVGTTTVTWTARDMAGNVSSATQTVTIQDTVAPVVTAPADIIVEATGRRTIVPVSSASASDAVGVVAISNDVPADFGVGITTITWTAVDAAGNRGTSRQRITVVDTTAPVISVPADILVNPTSAAGATVSYTAQATDLVTGAVIVVGNPASGGTFPSGTTTVRLSATDGAGNTANATFTVTVRGQNSPLGTPLYTAPRLVPARSTIVAQADKFTKIGARGYTFAFFLRPYALSGTWSNILHKGMTDGERSPMVAFIPGTTRLILYSATSQNPINNIATAAGLTLNTWTHVALVHAPSGITVYINGVQAGFQPSHGPKTNSGPLYVSSPWLEAAKTTVGNLNVFDRPLSSAEIATLASAVPNN